MRVEACRMCLAVDRKMYSIVNTPLEDMYEKTTGRQFYNRSSKPVMACYFCHYLLTKWLAFTERSLKVDDMLEQMQDCGIEIKYSTISTIKSPYLKPPLVVSSPSYEYSFTFPDTLDVPVMASLVIKTEVCDEYENAAETAGVAMDIEVANLPIYYPETDSAEILTEIKIEEVDNLAPTVSKGDNEIPEPSKDKTDVGNTDVTQDTYQQESGSIQKVACKHCGEFFDRESLEEHEDFHTRIREKLYSCVYCSEAFNQKEELDDHVKLHKGKDKNYSCVHCDKTFNLGYDLTVHVLRKHLMKTTDKKTQPETLTCNICNKSFTQKRYLQSHSMLHAAEKSYNCNDCGETFTKNYMYQRHLLGHKRRETFKCDNCGMIFQEKTSLESHMKSHEPLLYRCEVCTKIFTSKSALNNHSLTHKEKTYHCSQCDKAFVSKFGLKTHIISHTEEKRFVCTICSNVYKHQSSLANHMETHRDLRCDVCGMTVKNNRRLKEHKKTHAQSKRVIRLIAPEEVKIEMSEHELSE